MAKFLLSYTGGAVAQSEEEQQQVMATWIAWFSELGSAVVDAGTPFGGSVSIGADGAVTDGGSSQLTGYSIIEADSLQGAAATAKGCPLLAAGGAVDVYETVPM